MNILYNTMVNYVDGKIYQIVNTKNDKMYVGSTCQTLNDRMINHRTNAKDRSSKFYKAMREIGIENFSIHLYTTFPCQNKTELEAEEYKVMKEHQESGVELYNEFIGRHSDATKRKISEFNKGRTQSNSFAFNYGSIYFHSSLNNYRFQWTENGQQKNSSFSCNKYGVLGALQKAQDARKARYPEWKTPEEETLNELYAIEC